MPGSCPHCSARFKFMNGDQICGRCKLYISHDKKEISKEEAERGNMCFACGKVWGRLANSDGPCGECMDRDEKMVAIQQTYERLRESATEDRLTHPPPPAPRQPLPPPVAGKSSRTAEYEERLSNARSKVGNFKYLIIVEILWNGPKDVLELHPFGRKAKEYGPTEAFAVVLGDLFAEIIIPWWTRSQQVKLSFDDVTWSFSSSKIKIDEAFLDPEGSKTLGTFVATFSQPERYGQFFAAKEMKKGGGGVKQFVLSAHLNHKMAIMRAENHYTSLSMPLGSLSSTQSLAAPFAYSEAGSSTVGRHSSSGKKRRNKDFSSSEDEGATPAGRPVTRASAKVLQSPEKFVEKRIAPSTRQVVFRKRYAAVYGKTWGVRELGGDPINGTVTETAFNTSGETKDVFILKVGDEEFAAKQFKDSILLDLSDDTGTNLTLLEGELVRAAILQTQLQGFRNHVKKVPGVEEIVDIHPFAIPQTFIARETTLVDGMKQHYICEPLRSRTEKPIKFSGINRAGRNAGAAGGTADALAHYSLIASKGNLVLVDLQAMRVSPEMKKDGIAVLALFDPMCHMSQFSKSENMFFLNNGDAGIEAWKAQHLCNAICRALGLDKIEPTAPDNQRPPTTQTVLAIDEGENNKPGEQFFDAQVGKPEPPKYDHGVQDV